MRTKLGLKHRWKEAITLVKLIGRKSEFKIIIGTIRYLRQVDNITA